MSDAPPVSARSDDSHLLSPAELAMRFEVDPSVGLGAREVERRILEHGENRLDESKPRPRWLRFLDQFNNMLVYVLLGAAVLSAAVGDLKDPIVILVVLLINAVFGYLQENRADDAMAALSSMLELVVRVRRDGVVREVPAAKLVPGDVVLLEAGDRIPADGRFVVANNLAVEEAALTGESHPADKFAAGLSDDEGSAIGDRANCGFMNTTVVRGRAELIVTSTGMGTEVGALAGMLADEGDPQTPLQRQLDVLGKRLATIAAVAVLVVFVLAMVQGETFADAALEAVALAVAAIPEGLPAVVTVTLAIGVARMAERNAIVKRLASVETLGSTTAICSDKTGTLTLNQMTAVLVVAGDEQYRVSGLGYGDTGSIEVDESRLEQLRPALAGGVLCSEAVVRPGGRAQVEAGVDAGTEAEVETVGDPTELALVVLARKAGLDPDALRSRFPRFAEVPFESSTKFMATLHEHPDDPARSMLVVKGAPDVVLARCTSVRAGGSESDLDDVARASAVRSYEALGAEGLRVIALATRTLPVRAAEYEAELSSEADDMTLDAMVGILDPARPEVVAAVEECADAGVRVRMITGDHASTAAAIASELGIQGEVVTGVELDAMTDEELVRRIEAIGVCARVSPKHKVRVVEALQSNGEVVAMTGDGVNDAPALKRAEIGVAMGITGTEVTKEAGDMILADDNFATIVTAVERGRAIYDNILSFVRFQLTTNIAAIASILLARLAHLPTPFNPIQVLFVNIIADGPPAMSLGVDPPRPGLMQEPPRPPQASILSGGRLVRISVSAALMTALTLGVLTTQESSAGLQAALTMTFTTFVFLQLANALAVRFGSDSVVSRHSLTNPALWLALSSVALVQVAVVQVPLLQPVFGTVGLSWIQWAICLACALGFLILNELRLLLERFWASRG